MIPWFIHRVWPLSLTFKRTLMVAVGCSTFDRAYDLEVTWTQEPVVHVFTNSIVVTNFIPQSRSPKRNPSASGPLRKLSEEQSKMNHHYSVVFTFA
jgi:hypothetical protein